MSPTGDLLVTQFFLGKCPLELAQGPSCVALAWHKARGSTPFGVTNFTFANTLQLPPSLMNAAPMCSSASCCLSALILALSLRLLHLASLLLPGLSFAFCLKGCLFSLGLCSSPGAFFCKASVRSHFLACPKVLHHAAYHSVHFITHQSFAFY